MRVVRLGTSRRLCNLGMVGLLFGLMAVGVHKAQAATPIAVTRVTGGSDGKQVWDVQSSPELFARLPAALRQRGTLNIATDPSSPPYESYGTDNRTLHGADIDLGDAIAAKLGLTARWTALQFPGIIAAIEAGRFDMAMASMGDTPARERQVDFVDYSTDGNALIVPRGNPKNIRTIADLCGKSIAVLQGSVMLGLVEKQNARCTQKIDIRIFSDLNQVLLQVLTGRADATMYQFGVAAYIIKTTPSAAGLDLLSFQQYGVGYNAIPFRKSDTALRNAVADALRALKADGIYARILAAWGMGPNGLEKITVNDGQRFNQPSN